MVLRLYGPRLIWFEFMIFIITKTLSIDIRIELVELSANKKE